MRTRIRRVTAADAGAVQAIYAPFVSDSAISFETVAPDAAAMLGRIEAQDAQFPWLVCEVDREVVGYAYASAHRSRQAYQWSVDVSVYVGSRLHRRGIGRALYLALFDLLRRQHFVNAYAGITLPNPSSVGLHTSLGFEPVGTYQSVGFKFNRWHDVLWLHLRLREDPAPHDPLPTRLLWEDAGILDALDRHAQAVSGPIA
jgi:phosphinothricin acetyltransferase